MFRRTAVLFKSDFPRALEFDGFQGCCFERLRFPVLCGIEDDERRTPRCEMPRSTRLLPFPRWLSLKLDTFFAAVSGCRSDVLLPRDRTCSRMSQIERLVALVGERNVLIPGRQARGG